ncbi:4-hydroxy-tetrahydrodipicolinate synthase [Mitsuokella sp. oral taxon 131]|uniref:4-hydroxy-tetrahydrodipicolinate synthase n=1 Tax=Mitsuokella sp. oral taxon 131 TaxID=1321780 RepID=UPI0003AE2F48|nr:4-hydroxy-tetrahydrodipicolinate synthase [Mitsuokella sp. oral taxon 131]ERL25403.1 dihydrodipicolinate synthase [Mitsuokella sp. oral taxon 131 str. W9106]
MFEAKGLITPVVTALTEEETFDAGMYREFIQHLIEAGVDGIFPMGTNGEFYAFDSEEKLAVIKTAVEAVGGRVPVYAGTGCITTKETVEFTKRVEALGVDCLSVISPYFVAVTQDDLLEHFSAVAASTKLPMLLYNIPARTGNNIAFTTVRKLMESHENIIGIKDSSGSFDNTLKYIENTKAGINVLAGSDSLILWTLMAGGTGAISGCSNVFPELMVSIYQYWKEGNIEKANEAQKKIRPFRNVMQMGNPNSVVKLAVNMRGWKVGPARRPSNCTNPAIKDALTEVFRQY